MYRRFHERFGTAGVVLGVIALILALGGSALAAKSGLTGKQKKEVKAIAKSFQGTGPAGPAGTPGANGTPGKDGVPGTAGKDGVGTPGANGKSVVSAEFEGTNEPAGEPCAERGGSSFKVEGSSETRYACNGEEGPRGPEGVCSTSACSLPHDVTETGAWSFNGSGSQAFFFHLNVPVSFNIPLAAAISESNVHYVTAQEVAEAHVPAACENAGHSGTASVSNPEATSGNACFYETILIHASFNAITGPDLSPGVGISGAIMSFAFTGEEADVAGGFGSWAVTG